MSEEKKKEKDTVTFNMNQVPIRRALKRSNKIGLLVLIIGGFIAGAIYAKYYRVPYSASHGTQTVIEQNK